jgi:hypothetical protein
MERKGVEKSPVFPNIKIAGIENIIAASLQMHPMPLA